MTQTQNHTGRTPLRSVGLLRAFVEAGVLEAADVHVATRLSRLGAESADEVLLAVALAVRAVRHGSVCLRLADVAETTSIEDADDDSLERLAALAWPEASAWRDALAASSLVTSGAEGPADRPLRLMGDLLYLDRYWRQEQLIAHAVDQSRTRTAPDLHPERARAALARLFPTGSADRQRLAAGVAAGRWLTVLAGGPGTGKTTTLAKLLAVLADQSDSVPRIALAAPTGKAQARMKEAVDEAIATFEPTDRQRLGEIPAMTLHRLLGSRGPRSRFRYNRDNRLPFDVVVVDEASMVALTLMARLVEALRSDARLILVGDPFQLASVEAGAVLGDLVRRAAPDDATPTAGLSLVEHDLSDLTPEEVVQARDCGVVTLDVVHRHGGDVKALADAIKDDRVDDVLALLRTGQDVSFIETDEVGPIRDDVMASGRSLLAAASAGQAQAALTALVEHRILCAHREGPFGVGRWSRQVEEWLREASPEYARGGLWYVGRPLLVTSNDRDLGLFNGDTGVVVDQRGEPMAVFPQGSGYREVATNRLGEVTTVHAMSVHKSQGSQFGAVTFVLPEQTSPLLTKELFYTAVTRARTKVRVVGTEEAVRAAVARRIQRASGLAGSHPQPGG